MHPRIAVVSLWAEDVEAEAEFYRTVLGLKALKQRHGKPHFDVGGVRLAIVQGRPVDAATPTPSRFPVIVLEVEDLDGAIDRLKEHGVRLPWGVGHDARSRWVMFRDPGGNLVELLQEEEDEG